MKGKYYAHYRTHNVYKVIDECLLENPETQEWIDGVVYEEAYHIEGTEMIEIQYPKHFIRSKKRFESSFSEVVIKNFGLS